METPSQVQVPFHRRGNVDIILNLSKSSCEILVAQSDQRVAQSWELRNPNIRSCAILGVAQSVESSCAIRPQSCAILEKLRNRTNILAGCAGSTGSNAAICRKYLAQSGPYRVAQSWESLRNPSIICAVDVQSLWSCAFCRTSSCLAIRPQSCAILGVLRKILSW